MRLQKHSALGRINPHRQIEGRRIQAGFAQGLWILTHRDGMQIDDAIQTVVVVLHPHPLPQRPHVVANG